MVKRSLTTTPIGSGHPRRSGLHGNIVTVAYTGADGWPHVSRRGTTQVLDGRTLAMWVRKRDDGLATAISDNPHVTLLYMDLAPRRVVYTLPPNRPAWSSCARASAGPVSSTCW